MTEWTTPGLFKYVPPSSVVETLRWYRATAQQSLVSLLFVHGAHYHPVTTRNGVRWKFHALRGSSPVYPASSDSLQHYYEAWKPSDGAASDFTCWYCSNASRLTRRYGGHR